MSLIYQTLFTRDLLNLTADSDFLAVAGGDAVDVWQHAEQLPRLQQQLQHVARVQLLLGERGVRKDGRRHRCINTQQNNATMDIRSKY